MLSSDPKRRKAYEASVDDQRDHIATINAAKQEREREIAVALLRQKLPIKQIAEATGLSAQEIKSLKKLIRQELFT